MISKLFYRLKSVIYFIIVTYLVLEGLSGSHYPFFILSFWFALMSLSVYLDNHVLMLILIPEFKTESSKEILSAQIKRPIIISIILFICGIIDVLFR
jgi:hypothetical protein